VPVGILHEYQVSNKIMKLFAPVKKYGTIADVKQIDQI
jgi:hypothetical protein